MEAEESPKEEKVTEVEESLKAEGSEAEIGGSRRSRRRRRDVTEFSCKFSRAKAERTTKDSKQQTAVSVAVVQSCCVRFRVVYCFNV